MTAHEEKAQQLGLDVHGIADEFVNWAISKDERKADWSAAFHNWLTREAKWEQGRHLTFVYRSEGSGEGRREPGEPRGLGAVQAAGAGRPPIPRG